MDGERGPRSYSTFKYCYWGARNAFLHSRAIRVNPSINSPCDSKGMVPKIRSTHARLRQKITPRRLQEQGKSTAFAGSRNIQSSVHGWKKTIEETLTFYRLPREHHKHLKSTNMLQRINQELKRRTNVIRIFPNEESALRLIRALAAEIHEDWIEAHRYLSSSASKR